MPIEAELFGALDESEDFNPVGDNCSSERIDGPGRRRRVIRCRARTRSSAIRL
jgi:hypothetical protein